VVGLCLGGGQIALGTAGTMLSFVALRAPRWIEAVVPIERSATGPTEGDLRGKLHEAGLRVMASRQSLANSSQQRELAST
jgi:hypothetical protein